VNEALKFLTDYAITYPDFETFSELSRLPSCTLYPTSRKLKSLW